jgi:hypothetical protein
MNFLWLGIKTAVTIASSVGGLFIFFVMAKSTGLNQARPWGILAASMFLAVAPWAFFELKESRAFVFTLFFMGISLLIYPFAFPHTMEICSKYQTGKGRLGCELFNSLHSIGGSNLVAAFWVSLGLLFLFGGYALYKKMHNPSFKRDA